jgi:hypothetical protein
MRELNDREMAQASGGFTSHTASSFDMETFLRRSPGAVSLAPKPSPPEVIQPSQLPLRAPGSNWQDLDTVYRTEQTALSLGRTPGNHSFRNRFLNR